MELTESSEIPKIDLGFDRNNFVTTEIVYSLSKFKEVIFVFFDLIAIVDQWEMTII